MLGRMRQAMRLILLLPEEIVKKPMAVPVRRTSRPSQFEKIRLMVIIINITVAVKYE